MDRITLQNYRCFGSEEQSARLAPLTLLVGPNSTGKTSFLALIRALWDVAFREVVPNFREHPYDLGSWDDIVHQPGGRGKPMDSFAAGFAMQSLSGWEFQKFQAAFSFASRKTVPFPVNRCFVSEEVAINLSQNDKGDGESARYRLDQGGWEAITFDLPVPLTDGLLPLRMLSDSLRRNIGADGEVLRQFLNDISFQRNITRRPFASAPIRSRPRRTYDPILLAEDSEGDYIPSYLASLYRRDADGWRFLKSRLETFGQDSELFDEISVRSLGKSDGDPFQIQVRKPYRGRRNDRRKGPWRNLVDVGYGVGQTLPLLVELLQIDIPLASAWPAYRPLFLLQQPEVHLHPQAQAALGTLFCQVAAGGRQLIIETHSDYIIDRVRMDVRDGTTGLKPEDVSILYFEPGDLAVKIHSIRIDKAGNVLDAPLSYGAFFMAETRRSIGL